ncbi:MAG: hypothetical protein ACE5JK_05435 [Candidatus Omnitrophota bacterium]
MREQEKEVLNGLEICRVEYEKDLLKEEKHQETADRVCEFLGVSSYPVCANTVKAVPDNLEEVISNYDEMGQKLRKTGFEKYLT